MKWEKSKRYPGYVCCPICRDTFIEPGWVVKSKWQYCPTCGTALDPPKWKEKKDASED